LVKRTDAIWFTAILAAVGLWLMYELVEPFLGAFLAAIFISIAISPMHVWLKRHVPGDNRPALLTTLLALLTVVLPVTWFTIILIEQTQGVYRALNEFLASGGLERLLTRLRELPLDRFGIQIPESSELLELAQTHGESIGKVGLTAAGSILGNVVGFIVSLFLFLFFLFFCLRDGERAYRKVRGYLPLSLEQMDRLSNTVHTTMAANVYGILAVAITQGGATGIALSIMGFSHGAFWALVAAVLTVIPIIGPSAVWIPASIYLMTTGSVVKGIVLLGIGFGIISNIDNVVRPLVIQGKVQMGMLAVLIALLGGVQAFGLLGLFAGPLILTVTGELLKILFEEIKAYRSEEPQATSGSLK
jgi:predicted PurR-regulated permease PerM